MTLVSPAWATGGSSSAQVFKAGARVDSSSAQVYSPSAIDDTSSAHIFKAINRATTYRGSDIFCQGEPYIGATRTSSFGPG